MGGPVLFFQTETFGPRGLLFWWQSLT